MESLINILELLKRKEASVVPLLQQGIEEGHIRKLLDLYNLTPNKEILDIYQLINGTAKNNSLEIGLQYFFPGKIFLSLEEGVTLYQEECIEYESWDKNYFPFFWDGNIDYLLINMKDSDKFVYFFSSHNVNYLPPVSIYDSIDKLFLTVIQCFLEGAYDLGPSLENIKLNSKLAFTISKRMNPNSGFWETYY